MAIWSEFTHPIQLYFSFIAFKEVGPVDPSVKVVLLEDGASLAGSIFALGFVTASYVYLNPVFDW